MMSSLLITSRCLETQKNRCFSLTISDKHLADLVFNGLRSYVKKKLEGHLFTLVNQVLDRALAQENRSKELASLNPIVLTYTS
jgi:hypothetical protein